MLLLTFAVAGPVLVTCRSAEGAVTTVAADDVLLPGVGSASLPVMVAVLVMGPAVAGAVALIVIVALAPDASEPTVQTTVLPVTVQVPWVEVAVTEVTPAGRVSVTVAPVAGSGPLLVAFTV